MGGTGLGRVELAGVSLVVPGEYDESPVLAGRVGLAPARALLPILPARLQLLPTLQPLSGHSDTFSRTVLQT